MVLKKCGHCELELPNNQYAIEEKESDGLSFYCKKCQEKRYNVYHNNKTTKYEKKLLYKLRKKNICITGLDLDKLKNLRINMYDYPGVMRPLLKDLLIFLPKYNLTYEEYIYISDKLKMNKMWIE